MYIFYDLIIQDGRLLTLFIRELHENAYTYKEKCISSPLFFFNFFLIQEVVEILWNPENSIDTIYRWKYCFLSQTIILKEFVSHWSLKRIHFPTVRFIRIGVINLFSFYSMIRTDGKTFRSKKTFTYVSEGNNNSNRWINWRKFLVSISPYSQYLNHRSIDLNSIWGSWSS